MPKTADSKKGKCEKTSYNPSPPPEEWYNIYPDGFEPIGSRLNRRHRKDGWLSSAGGSPTSTKRDNRAVDFSEHYTGMKAAKTTVGVPVPKRGWRPGSKSAPATIVNEWPKPKQASLRVKYPVVRQIPAAQEVSFSPAMVSLPATSPDASLPATSHQETPIVCHKRDDTGSASALGNSKDEPVSGLHPTLPGGEAKQPRSEPSKQKEAQQSMSGALPKFGDFMHVVSPDFLDQMCSAFSAHGDEALNAMSIYLAGYYAGVVKGQQSVLSK